MADKNTGSDVAKAETVPDLDEKQLRQLSDLVYKLLQEQLIIEKERRGELSVRAWR